MYRGQGELCLVQSEQARLEPRFFKAVELAQTQAARLWELRATVSLAELYVGFTKDQDLPDLVEARLLLASLWPSAQVDVWASSSSSFRILAMARASACSWVPRSLSPFAERQRPHRHSVQARSPSMVSSV